MNLDDFNSPSRRLAVDPIPSPFCPTCDSFGWVPFDRRLSTTRNPMSVSLVIRCAACNVDGRIPVPTLAAAKAILEGRVL
jgi:hypothetical protein